MSSHAHERRLGGATRVEQVGPSFPAFEPNWIDYRASLVRVDKRRDSDDETLEICPYCECEVDVTPAPHKPGCKGIGAARASSATAVSAAPAPRSSRPARPVVTVVRPEPDGLDLLEAMDAGEPLPHAALEEAADERLGPDAAASSNDEVPVLGEEAAVGDLAVSGAAVSVIAGEPERAATSPSPDVTEEPMTECKIEGCQGDASDAPRAGPTARLCADHRAARSAEISAARTGRARTSSGRARKPARPRPVKAVETAPLPAAVVALEPREAPPAEVSPLIRLLAKLPSADLTETVLEIEQLRRSLDVQLSIVEEAIGAKDAA